MRAELLVGAREFWRRLQKDLRHARRKAYIQTFSFEGDRVGSALGRAIQRCCAADRRLLVDGYSLLYHNDRLIPGSAWLSRRFRREVMLTHRWIGRLREVGARVRFSNPIGPSPLKLLRRNHKKLVVVDDRVVYLGGINFSNHNFAWHDMMFRIVDEDVARFMAADFLASWSGKPQAKDRSVGPLRLISLDGRGNAARIGPLLEALASAKRTVDVVSAYLSHPFTDHLGAARRRGVRVRVLTPETNNKGNLARHIRQASHRHGFELFRYRDRMNHMKAIVVDDELLIAGSSNFDFMSYHILEELILMTRDRAMVRDFATRVWEPDLAGALRSPVPPSIGTRLGNAVIRLGESLAGALALP